MDTWDWDTRDGDKPGGDTWDEETLGGDRLDRDTRAGDTGSGSAGVVYSSVNSQQDRY